MQSKPKEIVYVNGINTTFAEGLNNKYKIQNMTKVKTRLIFNPSSSITTSLIECAWGRWVSSSSTAKQLATYINYLCESNPGGLIYIVGHSQGTIIVSNAIGLIDTKHHSLISVCLFAPVNTTPIPLTVYSEVFINKYDRVVRGTGFGKSIFNWFSKNIMNREIKKSNNRFIRDGGGHSLDTCYLDTINEFTNYTKSRFFKLCTM